MKKLLETYRNISDDEMWKIRLFVDKFVGDDKNIKLPTEFLMKFREFDRLSSDKIYSNDSLNQLIQDIKINGIKNPIIFYYDPDIERGIIIEGNHRISIADSLDIKLIPTIIKIHRLNSNQRNKMKDIKLPINIFQYVIEKYNNQ